MEYFLEKYESDSPEDKLRRSLNPFLSAKLIILQSGQFLKLISIFCFDFKLWSGYKTIVNIEAQILKHDNI